MFELNKSYSVTNRYKKSYVEEFFYEKDGHTIRREIGWRTGTWTITLKTEEELKKLEKFCSDEFEGDIVLYDEFTEADFEESWDGCWEDWETTAGDKDIGEMIEEFEEKEGEDDFDYFSFEEYIEDYLGYIISDDKSYYSGTPLDAEPVT